MMFPKKNLFHSATLKLMAGTTLVIMAISLFFSISIYQLSSRHFLRQVERETGMARTFGLPQAFFSNELEVFRANVLREFRNRAVAQLLLFNGAILVLAAAGSYVFARRTLRPIERSVETQRQFTADASHELRTPLTAMKTEIEVALRSPALRSDEAKTLLRSNLEEIDALTELSDSLLRLARYEESNGLTFSPVALGPVLAEAHENVAMQAQKRKIAVDIHSIHEYVSGDHQSLAELFTILLDNAVKYSPEGSSIAVWSERSGSVVRVFVRDHGGGIRAADVPRIFDRFYRADQSRSKQRVHGYGLGLAIAKAIVVRHHGQIDVESVSGEGTTFSVSLKSPSDGLGTSLRRSVGR